MIFGALTAALLAPAPALAQETAEDCAAIAADAPRLACYDGLFRGASPAAGAEAEAVTIDSERLIPALPNGRRPAEMRIACEGGELSVQFRFAGQLVSSTGDIVAVTFQVDQGATQVDTLRASPDNTVAGLWTTAESRAFLAGLTGGTSLKVRMTPVRQRSLTVDFRYAPHADAIDAVEAACVGG